MRRLRVLHVNKYYPPLIGGVERVMQTLCEGLADRADVGALVCNHAGGTVHETINGVDVWRVKSRKVDSMPLSLGFFSHLRRLSKGADILHFHMPFPLGDAAYLLSGYRGRVAVYWHSDIVRQKRLLKVYKPLMDAFLKRVDIIFAATPGHVEHSALLRPYRDKCAVVPYGIDAGAEVSGACPARVLPQGQPGAPHVLFVGRLVYYKGVDVLLRAVARVGGVRLSIAGDGPLLGELTALAQSLGIADRVSFLTGLDDAQIRACLRDCDVFVLPSVQASEAFGLVQLQAMSFEKPVINTSLQSGVPYVSLNGQQGLTVPPGDEAALARAIAALGADPALARKIWESGGARVRECFSLDAMVDAVYAHYQALTDGQQKTPPG